MKEEIKKKSDELNDIIQKLQDEYKLILDLSNKENVSKFDLLERLVSVEKDVEHLNNELFVIKDKFDHNNEELKATISLFQELSGSVNQLKLKIDDLLSKNQSSIEVKSNLFWQFFIPILVAIVLFFLSIFYNSCSAIHKKNTTPNTPSSFSDYKNFELDDK